MLMDLMVEMVRREIRDLNNNNVRLHAIGDLSRLPPKTRNEFVKGIESTKNNSGLFFSRFDIPLTNSLRVLGGQP